MILIVHARKVLRCFVVNGVVVISFNLVSCQPFANPTNGEVNCSSEFFSYEDTCSFTCNTGYELTGSDTRTCQSDGSWNGTNSACKKGTQSINL